MTPSRWPARACATSPGSRPATARCGRRSCPPTGPVAEVVAAVAMDLAASPGPSRPAVMSRGCSTSARRVARIPGKHGGQQRNFTAVQVVIADQPGELARLFDAAGAAGVNIEDVRIEHSPGLPVGVAELSVRPDQAGALLDAMAGRRLAGSPLAQSVRSLTP